MIKVKKRKFLLLPGDGIGPEVTNQSIKVLKCIAEKFNHEVETNSGLVGAVAIDKFNDPYPDKTHELCKRSDAILFGAIGVYRSACSIAFNTARSSG